MQILKSQQNNRKPEERRAGAMQPLAVLPVFFKLAGKRAIVAGGSAAAAWKAELLGAAGATVEIYAPELSREMSQLIADPGAGRYIHHPRTWDIEAFQGAAIAFADAESDGEAQAYYCAAQAAGVPVNIIDNPRFCQFQTGSIVNRSPAVIGISTDGAAPILGQAIRRRIETLLPPFLQDWADIARQLRPQVMKKLVAGQPRRKFWKRFSETAFARAPEPAEADGIANVLAAGTPEQDQCGRVTLVGAGPGDAELLTLKAVRALQSADVILFDDLVSDDVLELARREARRMLVGKRGKRASCKQEDINGLMIKLARTGKHVVRLKSGDPMVFGRAGEEIARLCAAGISVSVVPGITSALAMASALGVSLTHRDNAQSVRFVTAHSRKGELPDDIDWRAIADANATTVFYMGGRTVTQLCTMLERYGLPESHPAVAVSAVSRLEEQRWAGDVADLPAAIAAIGFDQPILIGVGRVFENLQQTCQLGNRGKDKQLAYSLATTKSAEQPETATVA